MERQLILKEVDIVHSKMQKNYCNSTLQSSAPKCQYSAWLLGVLHTVPMFAVNTIYTLAQSVEVQNVDLTYIFAYNF